MPLYTAGLSNPVPGDLLPRRFSFQTYFGTPAPAVEVCFVKVGVKTYRMVDLQEQGWAALL